MRRSIPHGCVARLSEPLSNEATNDLEGRFGHPDTVWPLEFVFRRGIRFFTINKMSYQQSGNPIISAGP
jgi:hypothetical protein